MAVLTMASLVSGLNKKVGQWFFKENHLETYFMKFFEVHTEV